MSSTYRLLCMSHDPAVQFGNDGRKSADAEDMLAEVRDDTSDPHHKCDILFGRYSYPLIQVGCPGTRLHRETHWIDAQWLRLALADVEALNGLLPVQTTPLGKILGGCWTRDRLLRLRKELNP